MLRLLRESTCAVRVPPADLIFTIFEAERSKKYVGEELRQIYDSYATGLPEKFEAKRLLEIDFQVIKVMLRSSFQTSFCFRPCIFGKRVAYSANKTATVDFLRTIWSKLLHKDWTHYVISWVNWILVRTARAFWQYDRIYHYVSSGRFLGRERAWSNV